MTCWDLFDAVAGKTKRILLHGPPGTGKTTAAVTYGNPKKVYSISLTDGSTEAELRGHYLPVEGRFEWRHGPAVAAWMDGARLVINEIDHASAEVLTFLHAILDDQTIAGFTLPTKQFVKPKGTFETIATMNGDPNDLPPALRDRFPTCIEIDKAHPKAISKLPPNLRAAARKTAVLRDSERQISTRVWAAFAELQKAGVPREAAAAAVFGHRAADVLAGLRVAKA